MSSLSQGPRNVSGRMVPLVLVLIVAIGVVAIYYGYYLPRPKTQSSNQPLIFYVADAYVPEAQALAMSYSKASGVQFAPVKSGGSFALARQIASGNPADLFLSAAERALTPQYMGNATEGWGVAIAADQMVLAYVNSSLNQPAMSQLVSDYSSAVRTNSTTDWYNFFFLITSGSLKVGISNPNDDPGGLRGWLSLELAGVEYASNSTLFTSRIMRNDGNVTALNAAALVAPLEEGQIQLLYIYRSAAVSDNLSYFALPAGVNLGYPSLNGFYSQVSYTTSSGVQKGQSILIFLTVTRTSTQQDESIGFVVWCVKNANVILPDYGLTPLARPLLYNSSSVPPRLNSLISQGYLTVAGNLD